MTALVLQRLLKKNGWKEDRHNKHKIFTKEGFGPVSVPVHPGDLNPNTVAAILKAAGIENPRT